MCFQHLIMQVPKDLDEIASDLIVIFDNEDCLARTASRTVAFNIFLFRALSNKPRNIDFNRRPFSDFAVDFDMAAGLFDEAVNLAKPESGPFAHDFCREKWLKYAANNLFSHSCTS